jgi:hypothetical protein
MACVFARGADFGAALGLALICLVGIHPANAASRGLAERKMPDGRKEF